MGRWDHKIPPFYNLNKELIVDQYEEVKIDLCQQCNGACCKVFKLTYSKLDMIKIFLGINKKFTYIPNIKSEMIRQLFWLKSIDHLSFVHQFKKKESKYTGNHDHWYTCTKLSKDGKCKIYNKRLIFCYSYTCYGQPQIVHQIKSGKFALPRQNVFNKEMETVHDN